MKKIRNLCFSILMTLVLLLSGIPLAGLSPSAFADSGTLEIRSREDWLAFVKNCTLDSYSKDLTVELKSDINLYSIEDPCVPVFCGQFLGNGHTISGFFTDVKADRTGLFRVLEEKAVVKNLNVSAFLKTDGERKGTGILCGENKGTIRSCSASGTLEGYEMAGAIAGINLGTITDCSSNTELSATLRSGGIAGQNDGTIKNCTNNGTINIEANETATDIGGITGKNTSVIINCTNNGEIGYLHTGYNVGGIAGISSGFINECENRADISGRRDVGGIAGQMEPSFRLEYGKNALKLLENSTDGLTANLSKAAGQIQKAINNGADGLTGTLGLITAFSQNLSAEVEGLFSGLTWVDTAKGHVNAIRTALQSIRDHMPGGQSSKVTQIIHEIEDILKQFDVSDTSTWPDLIDELSSYLSQLSFSLDDLAWVSEDFSTISGSFKSLVATVTTGLQSFGTDSVSVFEDASTRLAEIITSANAFLEQAKGDVGIARGGIEESLSSIKALQESVTDVLNGKTSTEKDISSQIKKQENGMITSCTNSAAVQSDYSAGGITGNLSKELSIDQEEDPNASLTNMLFTDTTLFIRATVYDCKNTGELNVKYDYVGGILGYGSRGSVISCESSSNLEAGNDYCGGIAGVFRGTIKKSASIGRFKGDSYVGGIAGDANIINRCRAVPTIDSEGAYLGGIAGNLVKGKKNLFASETLGGVNGISYAKTAKPLKYEELITKKFVPDSLKKLTLRFEQDGVLLKEFPVSYGGSFDAIPDVKPADGKYWCWDEFEASDIRFSQTVDGEWKNLITTIATGEYVPTFLAEGLFDDTAGLKITRHPETEAQYAEEDAPEAPSAYTLELTGSGNYADTDLLRVRFFAEHDGRLLQTEGNETRELSYQRDGRYIVFDLKDGGSFVFIPQAEKNMNRIWFVVGGAVLVLIIVIVIVLIVRKKKKKAADAGSAADDSSKNADDPETAEDSIPNAADDTAEDTVSEESPDNTL